MKRLRLSPAARADLDAIWDYSKSAWGADQADSYLRGIFSMMWTLAERPSLGRRIEEVRPGYLKFPVASHVIFYRQTAEGIDVIRILHKRMDLERHLG
jgi:toxin ParE1/3/4